MEILPIILFFLGVVFLLLGWRWQGLSKDQDKTVLKGLALLRREIIKVQNQVNLLEEEVQRNKQDIQKGQSETIEIGLKELKAEFNEFRESQNHRKMEPIERKEVKVNPLEINQIELKALAPKKIETLIDQENKESSCENELPRYTSPKYQQVFELAARGQRVPEIAQNLLLSQDAVQMVLKTYSKGVN